MTELKLSALGTWAVSGYPMLLQLLLRAMTQDQLPFVTSSNKIHPWKTRRNEVWGAAPGAVQKVRSLLT